MYLNKGISSDCVWCHRRYRWR